MRTVLQGTPDKLYRLKRRDLPRDNDLRYSFWRWIDFSDYDLSAYRMENMDIIGSPESPSRGHNVILPDNGRTDYLISRWTDWTGAKIPPDVSSYPQDLVKEVLQQAAPRFSGRASLPGSIAASMLGDYHNSWRNIAFAIMQDLGLTTLEELQAACMPFFEGYPRLEGRLRWHINHSVVLRESPDLRRDLTKLRWEKNGKMVEEDIDTDVRGGMLGYDRWAAARMLEQKIGTDAPLSVYFGQLHPEPVPFFGGTDVPFEREWFRDRWPA